MKNEGIHLLIESGKLSSEEIEKTLKVNKSLKVIIAALESSKLSDKEKITLVKQNRKLCKFTAYSALIDNLKKSSGEEFRIAIELSSRKLSTDEFYELIHLYLDGKIELLKKRIQQKRRLFLLAARLIKIVPERKYQILKATVCLMPKNPNAKILNKELLKIGFSNPGAAILWGEILSKLTVTKLDPEQITKILSQKNIARLDRLKLLRYLLRDGKLSREDLVKEFYRLPTSGDDPEQDEEIIYNLVLMNFSQQETLALARSRKIKAAWQVIADKWGERLLLEKSFQYSSRLLRFSDNEKFKKILIQSTPPYYLRKILFSRSASFSMKGYIIKYGDLENREIWNVLKYHKDINKNRKEEILWISLIESEKTSADKILWVLDQVRGYTQKIYQTAAKELPLSSLSFDKLLEIGLKAQDFKTWERINIALNHRKNKK